MKAYEGYSIATLSQNQIDIINNTEQAIQQNSNDDIVLIAYKKNKCD